MPLRRTLPLFAVLLATAALQADDGAASIAAGGIVLMKREPRIVMAKEVLRIGSDVIVDYDFRNDSDDDITTEVAFPIPSYKFPGEDDHAMPNQQGFDDFKLWVDEKPLAFETQVRAFVGKQDITELLKRMKVDAASFGHYGNGGKEFGRLPYFSRDVERLTPEQQQQLVRANAMTGVDDRDGAWSAEWRVEKKYHWTQTFPARGIVHIRHQYTPVRGNSNMIGLGPTPKEDSFEAKSVCLDPSLRKNLAKLAEAPSNVWISYVDFILTTANTWKTPIEDFTLIVERLHLNFMQGKRKIKWETFVSFCWDGPVTKIDADHFSAHIDNFVPKKEITIGFITADDLFKGDSSLR